MEHLDVLIVGAGLSGIGAAWRVQEACPTASYAVFESRDAIGGTWDLFRYPGIRSDSDMFTLGYPFRPWERPESIAEGGAILQYIKETAAEGGIDQHIRFNHRVVAASWSTADAMWTITFTNTESGETSTLTASFVFSCSGYYRYDKGHTPTFPGADDFAGTVVHPQHWPEDLDYADKNVVVVGSGATAITLIPSMSRDTKHITMLQRSPTYVAALPGTNPLTRLLRKVLPKRIEGATLRWFNALMTQGSYQFSRRYPDRMRKMLRRGASVFLPEDYDVETHFTPTYNPWDQRLCVVPDGDLFREIKAGRASVVTDRVETFTSSGIRLESGDELDADIIVTATGLELLFIGGIELSVDGEPVDVSTRLTYKGMMLEDVPNLAIAVGYTNASWTLKSDLISQYVGELLVHMAETGMRQCTVRESDPDAARLPLLPLKAGYVQRSAHKLPKQGTTDPWIVHQSYLRDYRLMKRKKLEDGVMRFSNPAGRSGRATVPNERQAVAV